LWFNTKESGIVIIRRNCQRNFLVPAGELLPVQMALWIELSSLSRSDKGALLTCSSLKKMPWRSKRMNSQSREISVQTFTECKWQLSIKRLQSTKKLKNSSLRKSVLFCCCFFFLFIYLFFFFLSFLNRDWTT
jgi:hypothetical protein